ncbi:MAG: FtsH protease activity modulator HflK [Bacteriovoracaceae bacterium]|nr:FtsH protease activity modulator HflK [Bacteriovoracaceae bacterium]
MNPKYKVCIISIVVCFLLAGLKYVFSIYSGSVSLKADALHSLLDMMTSALVLAAIASEGIKFKNKKYRLIPKIFEIFVLLVIIFFVAYFGIGIFSELSYPGSSPDGLPVRFPFLIIFTSLISIFVSHFLYRYQKRVGMQVKSPIILADAFETRMDQVSSFLVLLSTVGLLTGLKSENTFVVIILGIILFNVFIWLFETIYRVVTNKEINIQYYLKISFEWIITFIKRHRNLLRDNKKPIGISMCMIVVSMLVIYLLSGIYSLRPGQMAVVQYFGKHVVTLGATPGLNYCFPKPFSTRKIFNVDEIKRIEIRPFFDKNLRYYITKDENLIDISMGMQFKISDLTEYFFNTEENKRIIEDILEATTTEIIGQFDIDDALVHKKQTVLNLIREKVQNVIKQYSLGIYVLNIQFKKNSPPREVIRAFNEVSSAREDKRTIIDNALGYKNTILPRTRGEAFKLMQQAEAYKNEVVYNSKGDADRHRSIFKEYTKAPFSYKFKEFLKLVKKISSKASVDVIDSNSSKGIKLRIYKLE